MGRILTIPGAKAQIAREKAGVPYHHSLGGVFTIRYARWAEYQRKREQIEAEERAALGLATDAALPAEAVQRAAIRAFFGTVLVGWSEVAGDEAGAVPLEFTEANWLLLAEADPELPQRIEAFTVNRQNFALAQAEKNVSD